MCFKGLGLKFFFFSQFFSEKKLFPPKCPYIHKGCILIDKKHFFLSFVNRKLEQYLLEN